MSELETEMQEAGQGELPSILMSLLRQKPAVQTPSPVSTTPSKKRKGPSVKKVKQPEPAKTVGQDMKDRILGLMGDRKQRRSKQIIKHLKAKNPTSVYSVLSELVRNGQLTRPGYAVYQIA
jgi:hypothetical protein